MVKCNKKQIRQLKTALRWKVPAAQRERIQMVLLREDGMMQPAIAEAMGVSLSTVNRAHTVLWQEIRQTREQRGADLKTGVKLAA